MRGFCCSVSLRVSMSTQCEKMSVQDTHREREVTLVMSDVIVKGPP